MPRIKNILVVAESIDVEDSSGSKANVALIKSLVQAGFSLKVYHYTRKPVELPGIECISIEERKYNLFYFLSRIQRHIQNDLKIFVNKPLENRFGFSFTFLNDSKSITESLEDLGDYDPDLVLTLSKGASFRPHHALTKLPKYRAKWLAYIHDPYPFSYYPEPYRWKEPGNTQKIRFFRELSEKCSWVGFPSLLLRDWMVNYFPAFAQKSLIIPHQIQTYSPKGLSLPSYFDSAKFSLLHAGNLMKQRSPFALIDGYKKFLKRNPRAQHNSQLLLLGNADFHLIKLKKLKKEISQLYISEGNVEYDLVLELQKSASVNIILESTGEISPFLPGKFPHCIWANKTILLLAPEKSEVGRLLGSDYPYRTEPDDIEGIANLIEELYINWTVHPENLKLNRKDLKDYLSPSHLKTIIKNLG